MKHAKHPSKARWTKGELRRFRKRLIARFGSGPRAQQRILGALRDAESMTPDERWATRRLGINA